MVSVLLHEYDLHLALQASRRCTCPPILDTRTGSRTIQETEIPQMCRGGWASPKKKGPSSQCFQKQWRFPSMHSGLQEAGRPGRRMRHTMASVVSHSLRQECKLGPTGQRPVLCPPALPSQAHEVGANRGVPPFVLAESSSSPSMSPGEQALGVAQTPSRPAPQRPEPLVGDWKRTTDPRSHV